MSENRRLALRGLKLDWSDGRTERLLGTVEARLDTRRRTWRAALVVATLGSALGIALALHGSRGKSTLADSALRATPSGELRLGDGSTVSFDPRTSEARVVEEGPSRVLVELVRGSARYAVVPNPERAFEVHSGSVTVTVVGTEFTVERRADGARVEVARGRVRVSWGSANEQAYLAASESGIFPPAPSASPAKDLPAGRDEPNAPAPGREASQAYRQHVARQDYGGAYAVLSRDPSVVGDTVEELLVAADVARLSNHPSQAVPYLQRIIREHSRDARAPMAAFTLGRTLSGVGRHREAMEVFGSMERAWPKSPLAEDALVRQAEAAAALGDLGTAARIAAQYDQRYPNGRRRAEVRRHARLE